MFRSDHMASSVPGKRFNVSVYLHKMNLISEVEYEFLMWTMVVLVYSWSKRRLAGMHVEIIAPIEFREMARASVDALSYMGGQLLDHTK